VAFDEDHWAGRQVAKVSRSYWADQEDLRARDLAHRPCCRTGEVRLALRTLEALANACYAAEVRQVSYLPALIEAQASSYRLCLGENRLESMAAEAVRREQAAQVEEARSPGDHELG
jgi:hypothetical protein